MPAPMCRMPMGSPARRYDQRLQPGTVWNRLRPGEEARIRAEALRQPDWSPRELACWLTDHAGFAVSESTVYRVLKRHGLIRPVAVLGFPAGPEYRGEADAAQ